MKKQMLALQLLIGIGLGIVGVGVNGAVVPLGNFEDGNDGWYIYLGFEFPGAQGTLETTDAQARGGARSLRLAVDLSNGGAYVAAVRDIPAGTNLKSLSFFIKSPNRRDVGFRAKDSTGQIHQLTVEFGDASEEWREVKIAGFASSEHWGGANDGKVHLPIKQISICVGADHTRKAEVFIDQVIAEAE
jgi:hypothetical protein